MPNEPYFQRRADEPEIVPPLQAVFEGRGRVMVALADATASVARAIQSGRQPFEAECESWLRTAFRMNTGRDQFGSFPDLMYDARPPGWDEWQRLQVALAAAAADPSPDRLLALDETLKRNNEFFGLESTESRKLWSEMPAAELASSREGEADLLPTRNGATYRAVTRAATILYRTPFGEHPSDGQRKAMFRMAACMKTDADTLGGWRPGGASTEEGVPELAAPWYDLQTALAATAANPWFANIQALRGAVQDVGSALEIPKARALSEQAFVPPGLPGPVSSSRRDALI